MKRFNIIKKSRKKSKDIDEKIEYLNKECQKTGLNEITMSTSGIYSVSGEEENPAHSTFTNASFNGRGLAMTSFNGLSIGGATTNDSGFSFAPDGSGPATSYLGLASQFGAAVPGSQRSPEHRKIGSFLWYWNGSSYSRLEWKFNNQNVNNSGQWAQWKQGAFSPFLDPIIGDASFDSNLLAAIISAGGGGAFPDPDDITPPTNPVLFKNDLGDPSHLPIYIDGMSPQGFDSLLDKAIATKYKTEDEMWDAMIKFLENDAGQNPADDPFTRKGSGMGDRWIGPPVDRADYKLEGQTLSEGVKLGNFDPEVLNVDINDIRKGIMPEFPKDPPPEMINGYSAKSRLVPKKVEGTPFIKVTRKDLAKNHILTDKEIGEFLFKVNLINEYIKENPAELIYAMARYPKHDPRLAQLNFQMDRMKAASDQYMDTHFPENQKLFNKLQDKIRQNIEMTDPKNFKGHKEAPKFTDDDIEMSEQRKQIVSKYFKKPVKIKKLFKR